MKGIKWNHYVGCALVLALSFLLNFGLVKKSNALTLTTEVTATGNEWDNQNAVCYTRRGSTLTTDTSSGKTCQLGSNWSTADNSGKGSLSGIFVNTDVPIKEGNFYRFYITIQNTTIYDGINIPAIFVTPATNSNFTVADFKQISDQFSFGEDGTYYTTYNQAGQTTGSISGSGVGIFSQIYEITLQATTTTTTKVGLGDNTYSTWVLTTPNNGTINIQTTATISKIYEYEPTGDGADEMNKKDDEDRDNIESQQGETDSSAEGSSEDLDEGTTSLIGALSSFFSTMSNVSAGSCTLPEITAYGVSLGQLNLCTYSPPVWIQTALSVIVSLIAIRLALAIFRRIIKIVKSFTGGNG